MCRLPHAICVQVVPIISTTIRGNTSLFLLPWPSWPKLPKIIHLLNQVHIWLSQKVQISLTYQRHRWTHRRPLLKILKNHLRPICGEHQCCAMSSIAWGRTVIARHRNLVGRSYSFRIQTLHQIYLTKITNSKCKCGNKKKMLILLWYRKAMVCTTSNECDRNAIQRLDFRRFCHLFQRISDSTLTMRIQPPSVKFTFYTPENGFREKLTNFSKANSGQKFYHLSAQ